MNYYHQTTFTCNLKLDWWSWFWFSDEQCGVLFLLNQYTNRNVKTNMVLVWFLWLMCCCFFVLEQLLNYSFKMDTFLGQMTAVLLYTAGSLVHQLIIVITVYVTCVVFKAIDLYLFRFFICLSTFNSNKAEWIHINCQYVPMICFSFLGCSQHSQYVFSGTVPALPVSTGNTLTPTGHTGELH